MDAAALAIDPGLANLLDRNREALVRRWLMLAVERADFAELTRQPLGERVRELDLLWEAARGAGEQGPVVAEPAADLPPSGVTPLFGGQL